MFLDLFVYLFFNDNEINVNIPNFCPPVYYQTKQACKATTCILFFPFETGNKFFRKLFLANQTKILLACGGDDRPKVRALTPICAGFYSSLMRQVIL